MAYHVVWHHTVAPARILADLLALRFIRPCAMNILQTDTYSHARGLDVIEVLWVEHVG